MNTLDSSVPKAQQPDWNLLRAFLAVVDAGSLTGATRLLATSQPTLSRQIAELESSLGIALFERVARGLRLTAAGEALVWPARQMQTAAQAVSLTALGQTQQLGGTVRLTASEMTSAYVLPEILKLLRQTHPAIQIELVASNRVENLLERQADIAIRHTRPTQGGLVAKRVGDAKIGAFAHVDYLKRVGGEVDLARAGDYDWIGLDSSNMILRGFRAAGMPVEREFFAFRCDNQIIGWQAALAGLGIVFAPVSVAARWPEMQLVLPEELVPNMPVWVTAHRELRNSARIRLVFDALAEGLQTMVVG
ncbi:LysR family transcriptional regulator [Sulfurirhabdus autotrophica]|uniref:DNA-binding transcriptional LysR family regulator n=1 Tax=Sulfurirhabdus autotrophica TaxID=1706046 RepID=A0A4R3Y2N2_9PROT|nr:LysR family transcriptional regulator [Sulfurirhabdus autotrophica]TCV85837.1 DNA-binding transcriptional LysR family regulator [Sulfurirhabdus autotrophica]